MQMFTVLMERTTYTTNDKNAVMRLIESGFRAYAVDYLLQAQRSPETMRPVRVICYGPRHKLLSY